MKSFWRFGFNLTEQDNDFLLSETGEWTEELGGQIGAWSKIFWKFYWLHGTFWEKEFQLME